MKCILITSFIILFSTVALFVETEGNEGLLFDRYNRSLLKLPEKISKDDSCGAWATACPASEFAAKGLIKNALILQKIYPRGSKMSEVKTNVCDEPFKPSLVYDVNTFYLLFGFVIYYPLKDGEYFHSINLKNYMLPEEVVELMRKYSITKGTIIVRGEGYKRIKAKKNEINWFNEDQRMEFTWMSLFKLEVNFFLKILKKIVYVIHQNNRWPAGEQCEDNSLGYEVYEDIDVDKLYLENNQNKIFENINLPSIPQCIGDICKLIQPRLSKWLLIPMDQFVFGSSSRPLCSNLVTIPIWTNLVEKVLTKVDQYLFALHQITGRALFVTSGIAHDILERPEKKGFGKSKLYLDPLKKVIPVPKLIYKIVKYRASSCSSKIKSCWYSAVIVIHNDPYYKNGKRICYEDVTIRWGWQTITEDTNGKKFENIYVCQSDIPLLTKLLGRVAAFKHPPTGDLDLTNFPPVKSGEKNDIKQKVDEKLEKFSSGEESFNSEGQMVERNTDVQVEDIEGDEEELQPETMEKGE